MKFHFCPKCRRRINSGFDFAKVKLGPEAKVRLNCGNQSRDGKFVGGTVDPATNKIDPATRVFVPRWKCDGFVLIKGEKQAA